MKIKVALTTATKTQKNSKKARLIFLSFTNISEFNKNKNSQKMIKRKRAFI